MGKIATINQGFACLPPDRPPIVMPGEYDLKFTSYRTGTLFGRQPKLILGFSILNMGDYFQTEINRYYNIKKFLGKPGKNGNFVPSFYGDFVREYSKLFDMPIRLDRIPMSHFEKHIFTGKVKTVCRNSSKVKIPKGCQYSVVEKLIGIKDI